MRRIPPFPTLRALPAAGLALALALAGCAGELRKAFERRGWL